MKLETWIASVGGRSEAARILGVTDEAIHYWLKKGVTPRVDVALKIVSLSKGTITLEDILRETKRIRKGGRV